MRTWLGSGSGVRVGVRVRVRDRIRVGVGVGVGVNAGVRIRVRVKVAHRVEEGTGGQHHGGGLDLEDLPADVVLAPGEG